jgi:hypothetical protein
VNITIPAGKYRVGLPSNIHHETSILVIGVVVAVVAAYYVNRGDNAQRSPLTGRAAPG